MTNKIERGTSLHVRRQIEDALDTLTAGAVSAANPTATASDVAVNGVAATFMRSDAAPAVQKASSSVFGLVKVDGSTITASGGVISSAGGSPGGSNPQFQYNNSGAFGGSSGFTWDSANSSTFANFMRVGASASFNANVTGTDPAHLLELVTNPTGGDAVAGNFGLRILSYGAAARSSQHFARARGTQASPNALQNGDALFAIDGRGFNGSAMTESSFLMYAITTEDWTTSANGAKFVFEITPNGSTPALGRTERLSISSAGINVTGAMAATGAVTGSNLSGSNTGDQTVPVNTASTASQFLTAYNSTTGAFSKAQPTEADLSISDITTNNASTAAHGFLKKLDNNAAHYMDGTGAWSTPSTGLADSGANGVVVRTSAGVTTARTITAGSGVTVSNGDGVSGNPTISVSGGATPISSGTSNPGSPATNDLFFRTDLGLVIYYDGTRWLTLTEYSMAGEVPFLSGGNTTVTTTVWVCSVGTLSYNLYITKATLSTFVNTTNDGSNYWTLQFQRANSAATRTSIKSFTTQSDAPDTWIRREDLAINNVLDSTARAIYFRAETKTGSPGGIFPAGRLYYRFIIT